jgi:hypothetical protein
MTSTLGIYGLMERRDLPPAPPSRRSAADLGPPPPEAARQCRPDISVRCAMAKCWCLASAFVQHANIHDSRRQSPEKNL